jgi:hypothetical protein
MKIAYLHNLPLEYYPPATNTLDLLGDAKQIEIRAYTSRNLKGRKLFENRFLKIFRFKSPDPNGHPLRRLVVALLWHLRTAWALFRYKPDAVIYVEPHSALSAWLYYRFLFGKARLFIHHHELYEPCDYLRPGMRLPRIGAILENSFLFQRAAWISETNADRLELTRKRHPEIADAVWQLLPNYPPAGWLHRIKNEKDNRQSAPLRLIYVGSASFHDTYIEEIVRWAASYPGLVQLHICGYNVPENVWNWLETEQFANVTFDAAGYAYDDLPEILGDFDAGLVLYKGNTKNFIYNVPNKVFEYLVCGLEIWYPKEMIGMRHFHEEIQAKLRELDFADLSRLHPKDLQIDRTESGEAMRCCADEALAQLFARIGLK